MKNRDMYWRRYKIQETVYIGQWCLSPLQSRHLGTSHSSFGCHQLPHYIFLNLIDGLKSLPFQRWCWFWKKPEVTGHQVWAVGGLSHLIWCFVKKCTRCVAWADMLLWWSCQSPVAHSCGLLNHANSFHGGMFKITEKFDEDLLLYFLSHFEKMVTKYTCHSIASTHPPPTTTVKWTLFTHAQHSPLSLAATLYWCGQTILFTLTMAGFFPDRPHILGIIPYL